jgi:hypothetical protein
MKAMAVLSRALTARGVSVSIPLFKHGATASRTPTLRADRRSVVINKVSAVPPRPCSRTPAVCPIG